VNAKGKNNVTAPLSAADLEALAAYDTPMICNALELVMPERRAQGFNRKPLIAPLPSAARIVGYARTATIRAREPHRRSKEQNRELRLKYYSHVAAAPLPSIVLMQDLDGPDAGLGAFWGEVQTNVHKALGCLGVITDGSVRDIDTMAPGFFVLAGSIMPSHAHVDVVDVGGTISVAGMIVAADDLVHADRHGAVVIPREAVRKVLDTAAVLVKRERVILDACQKPGFSVEILREAFARMDEIH
jgi:regulator of RNase E activity RraA